MEAAGLRRRDTGTGFETRSGCRVAVVMTDAPTVDRYVEAGDVVVTNPDGTAGVKMSGDDPECPYELDKGLAKLYSP